LQAFCGKYITLWLRDKRSHGLFIALPDINSHAKGFYRQNFESNDQTTLKLMEEGAVLEAIYDAGLVVRPETISAGVGFGRPGEAHCSILTEAISGFNLSFLKAGPSPTRWL